MRGGAISVLYGFFAAKQIGSAAYSNAAVSPLFARAVISGRRCSAASASANSGTGYATAGAGSRARENASVGVAEIPGGKGALPGRFGAPLISQPLTF